MRKTALAVILLLGLGGCAPSDSGTGTSGAAATPAAPAVPPEVHFTARDFAFEGPDTIPSGMTTIVLHNEGPGLHHFMLMRLDDGRTVDELRTAMSGMQPGDMPPMWATPAGGVNPPMPGAVTSATFMIEPGTYAVVCEVDVPDHVPHSQKGMVAALTVTPSSTPSAPEPESDLSVDLVNFGSSLSAPFTAGHHVVKITNIGTQPHELELVQLAPGKTMDDLGAWGQTYEGPLPGVSLGGAAPMAPGQVEYVAYDLTPGDYALLCFVIDPERHIPHIAEGMVLPFTIE